MRAIREDLDDGVQNIVERAREMQDWRTYVQAYPWVFVGSAVALGYLMVPRRTRRGGLGQEILGQEIPSSGGRVTRILGLVGMMVFREVASQVGRQVCQTALAHSGRERAIPSSGPSSGGNES